MGVVGEKEIGAEPLTCWWIIDEVAKWCFTNSHPLAFADRPLWGIFLALIGSFLFPLLHPFSLCLLLNNYGTVIISNSCYSHFWRLSSFALEIWCWQSFLTLSALRLVLIYSTFGSKVSLKSYREWSYQLGTSFSWFLSYLSIQPSLVLSRGPL